MKRFKLSLEVCIRANTTRILSHMMSVRVAGASGKPAVVEQHAGSLNAIEAETEEQLKRFPEQVDS